MCFIIYLSYVASKYLAGTAASMGVSKYMSIIDRVPLGKDRFLLIVRVGEKLLFLGVTDQAVTNLSQLEASDLIAQAKPPQLGVQGLESFKQLLQKKIKSKVDEEQAPHD